MDFNHPQIVKLIELAIAEDLGDGDHSSLAAIPKGVQGLSRLIFKQKGILAGIELAQVILHYLDPSIVFIGLYKDGDLVEKGTIIATATGNVHSLLAAERIVLNFMQRLSGVATKTHEAMAVLGNSHTQLLDTRKTTPGMRLLEKWAVKIGGGENHRMGLYDMIMLKDNHNDSAGGITQAVDRTCKYINSTGKNLKIEVETRNMDEVREAMSTGKVDRIMLDNFSVEQCKEAVDFINHRAETEASGGIDLSNLKNYASSGVDYISLGFITHSAGSIDISMKTQMLTDVQSGIIHA